MRKQRIGVIALLAALVFCGFALAGSPTRSQYGNPTENDGPPSIVTPRLPFTGFQAGMVLLAGVGALTAGLMLRSGGPEERGPAPLAGPTRTDSDRELAFLTAPLEHCETCGKPLSSMGFRILRRGRSYDSVECARAQPPGGSNLSFSVRA